MASVAKLVNPLLAVLLVVAPLLAHRATTDGGRQPWQFWLRSVVALLVVYVLAHINRWLHLWPAHLLFPSGHLAFATCVLTSLALTDRRWLVLIPFLVVYSWMVVALGFHGWLDIGGAWLMSPPVTLLCHKALQRRQGAPVADSTH